MPFFSQHFLPQSQFFVHFLSHGCLSLITREHVGSVLVSPRGLTPVMTGFMHWGKARGLTHAAVWERARSAETGLHRPSLLPCQRQLCPPGTLLPFLLHALSGTCPPLFHLSYTEGVKEQRADGAGWSHGPCCDPQLTPVLAPAHCAGGTAVRGPGWDGLGWRCCHTSCGGGGGGAGPVRKRRRTAESPRPLSDWCQAFLTLKTIPPHAWLACSHALP